MKRINLIKSLGFALPGAALVLISNSITAGNLLPHQAQCEVSKPVGAPKPKDHERGSLAINGTFVTAIQVLPPYLSFPPDPFQPILHLLITASGELSHFGKATAATTDEAVDVSVIPNHGTGHWVFQNTKGDALWTDMDLTSAPLDSNGRTTFQGTLTVIGGSGKFAGATGTLLGEGFAEGASGSFSISGTVSVTGSEDD
jgi:hypothetical protein